MKKFLLLTAGFFFIIYNIFSQQEIKIITPEEFFGFSPGEEGMLFKYESLINYMDKLDKVSPRVKMIETGKSPLGNKIYIVFLSSEENIKNLENLKTINRELALNPNIDPEEKEKYTKSKIEFYEQVEYEQCYSEVGVKQDKRYVFVGDLSPHYEGTTYIESLGYLKDIDICSHLGIDKVFVYDWLGFQHHYGNIRGLEQLIDRLEDERSWSFSTPNYYVHRKVFFCLWYVWLDQLLFV